MNEGMHSALLNKSPLVDYDNHTIEWYILSMLDPTYKANNLQKSSMHEGVFHPEKLLQCFLCKSTYIMRLWTSINRKGNNFVHIGRSLDRRT